MRNRFRDGSIFGSAVPVLLGHCFQNASRWSSWLRVWSLKLGPGQASPPFDNSLGSDRPLAVKVPRSELPDRWTID
jgi:hypothetical protein